MKDSFSEINLRMSNKSKSDIKLIKVVTIRIILVIEINK